MDSSFVIYHSSFRRQRGGFTMIEAMILMTILSIVAVAAAVGLQSTVRGPEVMNDSLAIDRAIATQIDLLKQTATTTWNSLSSSAGTSTVTVNGKTYTQTITITAQAYPDGTAGTAPDFSKITIQIGNQSMITYVSQP